MTVTLAPDSPLLELASAFTRSLKSERKSPQTIEVYLRALLGYGRGNRTERAIDAARRIFGEGS